MTVLFCDFETRSHCDLKRHGVYAYARHPTTQVLCMAYAFGDEEVRLWTPLHPFPERVANHEGQIRAHNAAFERLIFQHVLGLDFKLEQFYCTATQARVNCAPGGLEDVGRFAGASMKKDHKGAALVRACCIPPYDESPEKLKDLYDYCMQDVRAMRAISQSLRDLTDEELADYHVSERINDRGVRIDRQLARAAVQYAAQELTEITAEIAEITAGEVRTARSPSMTQWVTARLTDEQRKLTVVHKDGEARVSMDKSVRANLLACDDLDLDVRTVIEGVDAVWASSTAKFQRMQDLAGPDDRVRGAFVFAGGSATGRFASYGLQVHNLPRRAAKNAAELRQQIVRGHTLTGRVSDVLRSLLRPALIPAPGHVFVGADWSAIEARVNPWLWRQHASAQELLNAFAAGEDVYVREARSIFGTQDIDDAKRQVGKVAILACGFGGGHNAFAAMGRAYKVIVPEADARRIVTAWRRANPWAVQFWTALDNAYTTAMRRPGNAINAGPISYYYDRQHLWYALPSGRVLCYPHARFDDDGAVSYAKASWKPAADAKEWPRARLWGGLACENIVQAVANDLLRHALRLLDAAGLELVLHCHDETLLEIPERQADDGRRLLEAAMLDTPQWAKGLPLKVEAKITTRYGK